MYKCNEEGNVLTWNIGANKTDIDFVFKLKSYDTIYYIVAIVIAIFLVFSIFGYLYIHNRDKYKFVEGFLPRKRRE